MLRLMLTCHPRIGIPPEAGFIVELGWRYGSARSLSAAQLRRLSRDFFLSNRAVDWALDPDALTWHLTTAAPCSFAHAVEIIYRQYLERSLGAKPRWGDKTTGYLEYLDQVGGYFPDATYVHIIRDGRDVAASFKRVGHLRDDVRLAALEWVTSVERIRRFGSRRPSSYAEVRYEELVTDPEGELRKLCEFLDEEYSAQMLQFAEKNRAEQLEPKRHMPWKEMTLQPASPSRIGAWQEALSSEEIEEFWSIAGDVMAQVGYGSKEVDLPLRRELAIALAGARYRLHGAAIRTLRPPINWLRHTTGFRLRRG